MKSGNRVIFAGLALALACVVPASADTIGLSTGTAAYSITSDTNGGGDGNTVFTVTTLAVNWLANPITDGIGDSGVWIGPNADQSSPSRSTALGSTIYQLTFSLSGLDPTSAVLTMNMAADDYASITLNGHTIFSPSSSQTSNGMWTAASGVFTVNDGSSYFLSGTNTLIFTVPNNNTDGAGSCCGPTGLDVAASVSANELPIPPQSVPEPVSFLLGGTGLSAFALIGWRRRHS